MAFLVLSIFLDSSVIFLVSVSFYFEDFYIHFNEDMCEIKDKHDALITKVKMAQIKMFSFEA